MRKNQPQMVKQISDLKSLLEVQKLKMEQAKKDSKKIFDAIINEAFNNDAFAGLVYQESLLELMLLSMDHAEEIKTRIGRQKGIDKKRVKKIADEKNVSAMYNVTGDFDDVLLARFKDRKSMDIFLKHLQGYDHIERTETSLILNTLNEKKILVE